MTLAVTTAGIGNNFLTSLLFGLIAGSYIIAMRRPAWALMPIIITELAIPGYLPGTSLSMRLAIVLASTAIAALPLLRHVRMSSVTHRVILPAIGFLVVVSVVNTLHSDTDYVYKYFRYQSTQIIELLLVAFLIRDRRDLKHVAIFTLGLASLSGFAAIWQHFSYASAIYAAGDPGGFRDWGGRALGLSNSPVILSADMLFALLPALGVLISGPIRFDRPRVRLAILTGLIFLGGYFTYSRSGMPAIGAGLAIMGLYQRGDRRLFLIGGLIGIALLFPQLENTGVIGARYYRDASDDKSAASHEVAWQVGLQIALDYPIWGIGHERFAEYAGNYVDQVDADLVAIGGTSSVEKGYAEPHNDFLNVWFSWGIFALLTHVVVYIGALINCTIAARSNDLLVRSLAIGTAGGLIAYAMTSALHNYLDSSAYLWIYAGLSVALAQMVIAEKHVSRRRYAKS